MITVRLSVPSLMRLAVTLVVVVLSGVHSPVIADPGQVARAITLAGGTIERDESSEARPIVGVRLCGPKIGDDAIALLKDVTTLRRLDLSHSAITDDGLKALSHLVALEEINLSGTRITDLGIAELSKMVQLKFANLEGTSITDIALAQLSVLPRMRFIRVGDTQVKVAKISEIMRRHPRITILPLSTMPTPGPSDSDVPDAVVPLPPSPFPPPLPLPPDIGPRPTDMPKSDPPPSDVEPSDMPKSEPPPSDVEPSDMVPGPTDVAESAPAPVPGTSVSVFYGTNRKPRDGDPDLRQLDKYYGSERGKLEYGVCTVGIPLDHVPGKIERPWSLGPIRFPEDPRKHIVLRNIQPKSRDIFFEELKKSVADMKKGPSDAFVFVHGFNVSFEDAAYRTAQLAFDLDFKGPAIMFSWPSLCTVEDYLADVDIATLSAGPLKEFLIGVAKESGARKIHLIAHSMGNLAMTRALADLAKERVTKGGPEFDQILLTAPDIDAEVFEEQIAPYFLTTARRVTLYASTNDWALVMSRRLRANRVRLGEDIKRAFEQRSIEAVDASGVDTSLLGHSYFGDRPNVILDIKGVFNGMPRERRGLVRWGPDHQYWTFSPLPDSTDAGQAKKWTWWMLAWIVVSFSCGIFLGRWSKRWQSVRK